MALSQSCNCQADCLPEAGWHTQSSSSKPKIKVATQNKDICTRIKSLLKSRVGDSLSPECH